MTAPARAGVAVDRATLAAFVGAVLIGGANAIAVRATLHELAPFWSASLRFGIAGLILAGIALVLARPFPVGWSLVGGIVYGLFGFAASYGLVYLALQDAPAGTGAVFLALTPLMTFVLAIVHRQEAFRWLGLIGAVLALAGVAVIFADQISADVPLASLLFLMIGVACIAESTVVLKSTPRSDPFWSNAVGMTTSAVILLALTAFSGEAFVVPHEPMTLLSLGYLIVPGSVVMFALIVFVIRRWTASASSYLTILLPMVTVPLAAVLARERVSALFLAGGAVMIAGVYVGAFLDVGPKRPSGAVPEAASLQAGK